MELYYSVKPLSFLAVTADYQLIVDPGSNADRGPVSIVDVRVNLEGVVSSG